VVEHGEDIFRYPDRWASLQSTAPDVSSWRMPVAATILLFASAREKAGKTNLTVDLPDNPTVLDLKSAMVRACPALEPLVSTLRIAIDSEYAFDDLQPIPPGAELAAIPPVSGGGD
jgi:molybdopterin converting factor small subunit